MRKEETVYINLIAGIYNLAFAGTPSYMP